VVAPLESRQKINTKFSNNFLARHFSQELMQQSHSDIHLCTASLQQGVFTLILELGVYLFLLLRVLLTFTILPTGCHGCYLLPSRLGLLRQTGEVRGVVREIRQKRQRGEKTAKNAACSSGGGVSQKDFFNS
jgi:hypothetical protein